MAKRTEKSKHVLAVRMLVAQTDWLNGPCRWADGRIAWGGRQDAFVPETADFARAQYCLTKIGQYPHASRIALGDSETWLRERSARLELAKRLRGLPTCDLERLTQMVGRGSSEAAAPLASLLAAEAVCVNALPVAPSAALLSAGGRAAPSLLGLMHDDTLPCSVRALAALVLGALRREHSTPVLRQTGTTRDVRLDECAAWGRRYGLPEHVSLIATLLAAPMGSELTGRYIAATEKNSPFQFSSETLREWLAEGLSTETILALAEAAAEAALLAQPVLRYRDGLPELKVQHERRRAAAFFRAQRTEALGELQVIFADYAEATRDPAALRALTVVSESLYTLAAATAWPTEAFAATHEALMAVLRDGRALGPAQQSAYLGLLAQWRKTFWSTDGVALDGKVGQEAPRFRSWLQSQQQRWVAPVQALLHHCGDQSLVEQALNLGIVSSLSSREWQDSAMYSFAVAFATELGSNTDDYILRRVWYALERLPTAREAQAVFQPVLQAVREKDISLRDHFLDMLLLAVGQTRQDLQKKLPLLTPFLKLLIAHTKADSDESCFCGTMIDCALGLAETVPAEAAARLDWLLGFLADFRRQPMDWRQQASMETGLTLAVTLAPQDRTAFQAIVQTATTHRFRQDRTQIDRSLALLRRFPALREPLAHLFPQQPQRCADLLVRLGQTTRLNTDVPALLARLEPQRQPDEMLTTAFPIILCPHADWWRLHRIAPELTQTANALLHAQWLRGESPDVPPGVRRVLDTPQRLTRELAHVEKNGLTARAEKLRRRLSETEALAAEICRAAGERLMRLAALAQIAAAERQVQACYRARLEDVAGPLPDGMELSDDLINAILLTTDIGQNRRLLLHLLRAHVDSEHDWREHHPANAAFLATLSAQGADTDAWLSEYPRRSQCAGVPGGVVHLRLESDPLAVLQMGNRFETCLSLGGVNAFSTVANACELNKRVVYARDGVGHVIGRQLIGLNADGDLIGFNTYVSLTEEADNIQLQNLIRQYVIEFAARCRLRLSDTGTVPTLFAEAWYDDGIQSWEQEKTDVSPMEDQDRNQKP